MMLWYPKGRGALLSGDVDVTTDTLKLVLLSATYTYDAAHDFLDDLSGIVATSDALASVTVTSNVLDAADVSFAAVSGDAVTAWAIYVDTGTSTTSTLLILNDGKEQIEVAADAGISATSVTFEDFPTALADASTLTKVSGTGPATITTAQAVTVGNRTIDTAVLGTAVTAGAVYSYVAGVGFPFTPSGGPVAVTFNASGIAAL